MMKFTVPVFCLIVLAAAPVQAQDNHNNSYKNQGGFGAERFTERGHPGFSNPEGYGSGPAIADNSAEAMADIAPAAGDETGNIDMDSIPEAGNEIPAPEAPALKEDHNVVPELDL